MALRRQYVNHKPSEDGLAMIELLRRRVDDLHTAVEASQPASRERSLALTKLEEALMWAVKGIVLNRGDSTPQQPGAEGDGPTGVGDDAGIKEVLANAAKKD